MRMQMQTKHFLHLGTLLTLCVAFCLTGFAQTKPSEDKKGKKENSEAVWKLQAQSVSDQLGLSKEQTAKLTAAYLEARKSHKQSLKALPEEKDKDKARAATLAAIEKDRAKFVSALKGKLTEELIAKVIPTLGSFNSKWDGYVGTLTDLKLEKAARTSAMKSLIKYVTDYEEASKESLKSFNRRPNSRSFKQTLDADLTAFLTTQQMAMWKQATAASDGKDKSATSKKK